MSEYNCKIGKVTYKDKKIVALNMSNSNVLAIEYSWCQITFRFVGVEPTNADILYTCECVKRSILNGEDGKELGN